jgi:hypothetical protein
LKKALTITVIVAALAATLSFVAAGSFGREEEVIAADALAAYEIPNNVRAMRLNPTSQSARHGPYYVLHAVDPRGVEMRVVADVQSGDIVSITPARASVAYAQRYDNSPRIIHVPQADEPNNGTRAYNRSSAVVPTHEDVVAPVRRLQPEPVPELKVPPAHPRRAILTAPSQPEGLSPVYPTPRWQTTVGQFGNPPPALSGPKPPIGYTPSVGVRDQNDVEQK